MAEIFVRDYLEDCSSQTLLWILAPSRKHKRIETLRIWHCKPVHLEVCLSYWVPKKVCSGSQPSSPFIYLVIWKLKDIIQNKWAYDWHQGIRILNKFSWKWVQFRTREPTHKWTQKGFFRLQEEHTAITKRPSERVHRKKMLERYSRWAASENCCITGHVFWPETYGEKQPRPMSFTWPNGFSKQPCVSIPSLCLTARMNSCCK